MATLKIMNRKEVQEFVRFCIVGLLCTILDALIYYSFLTFATYHVALISGYSISLLANYFLTIYWTFNTKPSFNNLAGVLSAHLFNLFIVRLGLLFFFVEKCKLSEQIGYIPMLSISVISNFIILKTVLHFCEKKQKDN